MQTFTITDARKITQNLKWYRVQVCHSHIQLVYELLALAITPSNIHYNLITVSQYYMEQVMKNHEVMEGEDHRKYPENKH